MTVPPALPILPGLAWSRHKKPGFSTRVASHVSGREVRVALMSYPLYEFEAVYNGLASSSTAAFAGLGSSSLQSLMGFFLQLLGQAGTFLYTDPDDNAVTGQFVAKGDGATQSFVTSRTLGGFSEPCSWLTNVTNVYLNGVAQASNTWAFTAPNSIGFYTAPGAGVVITADFCYAFQCRFLDDQMDFEEFMSSLWKLDSMKFRSVKANTVPSAPPQWYNFYAVGGTTPTLFANTATEGTSNHYLYNGTTYTSFAALLTALSGSFSRSSSAYYTNSSGLLASASSNVLRFDYDPIALTPKGILLEGTSTNLFEQSQALGTSPWSCGDASVTTNVATAPDGTTTASLLVEDNTTNYHYVGNIASSGLVNGSLCSASVYAKAATRSQIAFFEASVTGARVLFDLSAVTATPTGGLGSPSGSIQAVGNGWYRCTMTWTAGGTSAAILIMMCVGEVFAGYAGNGTSGLYLWGAQCEALGFASSYIPTTSSIVTRAADSFGAITWPAITAGTLYAKADTGYTAQAQSIIQIDDGTANNRASLSFNASATAEFDFLDGGSSEAALTTSSVTVGTAMQLAAAFQANDFALVANAGTPATASSGAIPSFGKLRFGANSAGANELFGHLAQFGVWNNLRAPNANLQGLT